MQREKVDEVSAEVVSVDPATRMLGLRLGDGGSTTVLVGDEVRNFNRIRVGDDVVVSYYRGIAAELQPKGTPLSRKVDDLDMTAAAPPGSRPAGGEAAAVRATVVIEKAGKHGDSVTFRAPDGSVRTLDVKAPEARNFVAGLEKGDQVEVLYVEAVAVEVRPK